MPRFKNTDVRGAGGGSVDNGTRPSSLPVRRAGYTPTSRTAHGIDGLVGSGQGVDKVLVPTAYHEITQYQESGTNRWFGLILMWIDDPNSLAKHFDVAASSPVDSVMGMKIKSATSTTFVVYGENTQPYVFAEGDKFKVEDVTVSEGDVADVEIWYTVSGTATSYDSVNDETTITFATTNAAAAFLTAGRVVWVRWDAADTGRDVSEFGTVGSDVMSLRALHRLLYNKHNSTVAYRMTYLTGAGRETTVAGSHTFDIDTRPDLITLDVWADDYGNLWMAYVGDEDTRSVRYLTQDTPFAFANWAAAIAALEGGTANEGRHTYDSTTGIDGFDTGVDFDFSDWSATYPTKYIAVLPYGDTAADITLDRHGVQIYYRQVEWDLSQRPIYRTIVTQTETTEGSPSVTNRYGILTLLVRDPFNAIVTSGIEERHRIGGNIIDGEGGGVTNPTSAWTDMSEVENGAHVIYAIDVPSSTFTVDGDFTEFFQPGEKITGSTAPLNITYRIKSVTLNGVTGDTDIVVYETIPDGTPVGSLNVAYKTYTGQVKLTTKANSELQWRMTLVAGPPLTGTHSFDYDVNPEIERVDAYFIYDETADAFSLKATWAGDEDVDAVAILATSAFGGMVWTTGYDAVPHQDPMFTSLVGSPDLDKKALWKGQSQSGTITYASEASAPDGGSMVIARGSKIHLYFQPLKLVDTGTYRAGALVKHVAIASPAFPKVEARYRQYRPSGDPGEYTAYHAQAKIYITSTIADDLITSATTPPNGVRDCRYKFSDGTALEDDSDPAGWTQGKWSTDHFLLPHDGGTPPQVPSGEGWPMVATHATRLDWIVEFHDIVDGPSRIVGSHTFDLDTTPELLSFDIDDQRASNTVKISYRGDEDCGGLCWATTEVAAGDAFAYPSAPTALAANGFYDGQDGTNITCASARDTSKFLLFTLKVLPPKPASGTWVATDDVSDAFPVGREYTYVLPPLTGFVPTVKQSTSQTGSVGALTLTVTDPFSLVKAEPSGVLFRVTPHANAISGSFSGSAAAGYAITGADGPTEVITIAGDYTDLFTQGVQATISGSAANDGDYIIASSVLNTGNTDITIDGDIESDATGTITIPAYSRSVSLSKKGVSLIEWQVVWTDFDAVDQTISGSATLDLDNDAEFRVFDLYISPSDWKWNLGYEVDEDAVAMQWRVSLTGKPTGAWSSDVTASSGTVVGTALSFGQSAWVEGRARNSAGAYGPTMAAMATRPLGPDVLADVHVYDDTTFGAADCNYTLQGTATKVYWNAGGAEITGTPLAAGSGNIDATGEISPVVSSLKRGAWAYVMIAGADGSPTVKDAGDTLGTQYIIKTQYWGEPVYDVAFFGKGVLAANEVIAEVVLPRKQTFTALAGNCGTNPSSAVTAEIRDNGAKILDVDITSGGAVSGSTFPQTVVSGRLLTLVLTSSAHGMADLSVTLTGTWIEVEL